MTTTNPAVPTPSRLADLVPKGTAGFATTIAEVFGRAIRQLARSPQVLGIAVVQSVLFLLMFRYVIGGAIGVEGVSYVDFLVPGFVGTGVLFAGMTSSIGAAEDLKDGFFDRLRSLPVPRIAIVSGRVLADTVLATIGLTVTTVVGFAMGFRTSAPLSSLLLAIALCVFAAFAFTWMFVLLGIMAGNPQAAQGLGILVFPFTFVSSAFVPVESMPGWMQAFASNQPLTMIVNATRAFTLGDVDAVRVLGHSADYFATRSLLWCALFIVVFAPLAARRYQRG